MPRVPANFNDPKAYENMDTTPLYSKTIKLGKRDLEHNIELE